MLNLDPEKVLVIAMFALVVLGPHRLPGAARSVGRVVGQLRKMSGSFQSEVRDALAEPRQVLRHAVDEFGLDEVRSSVAAASEPFKPSSATGSLLAPATPDPGGPAVGASPPPPDDPSFN